MSCLTTEPCASDRQLRKIDKEQMKALMKATRSWGSRFSLWNSLFGASVVKNGPLPTQDRSKR